MKPALWRLAGRAGGKPSRALIRADHPDPEAALADLVGPLAMFRWEVEPAAADFADPRTWGLDDPRAADVVPLMGACSRCDEPTPPGVAVCAGCAWLDERAAEPDPGVVRPAAAAGRRWPRSP